MIDSKKKYANNTAYQAKNYDMICVRVAKGQREKIQQAAASEGRSMANYIKHLIMLDLQKKDKNFDLSAFFGGGARNNEGS